jgi:glycosyltransferase involved in cell wall biosynthesis
VYFVQVVGVYVFVAASMTRKSDVFVTVVFVRKFPTSVISEVKRIPDVIQIFYKIQQKLPAKLMMVGDGPERKKQNTYVKN